jgi:hypothetical protein
MNRRLTTRTNRSDYWSQSILLLGRQHLLGLPALCGEISDFAGLASMQAPGPAPVISPTLLEIRQGGVHNSRVRGGAREGSSPSGISC